MELASLFWKIGFGFMLFALSVFGGYLWATSESVSDILGSVKGLVHTLMRNLRAGFINREIDALLQSIDETFKRLNRDLPRLLDNMSGIAASAQKISLGVGSKNDHRRTMTENANPDTTKMDH